MPSASVEKRTEQRASPLTPANCLMPQVYTVTPPSSTASTLHGASTSSVPFPSSSYCHGFLTRNVTDMTSVLHLLLSNMNMTPLCACILSLSCPTLYTSGLCRSLPGLCQVCSNSYKTWCMTVPLINRPNRSGLIARGFKREEDQPFPALSAKACTGHFGKILL